MSDSDNKKITVACPKCRNSVEWSSSPFRPFCSSRCQIDDQAAWASEEYKIASQPDESASSEEVK
ncbi:MAG: DNA gyrase inhibitor YacG [SAR324 cluster bacterium]|nr:DNA gyrase inhibitor YacG [SAR324 cluster bacterium]